MKFKRIVLLLVLISVYKISESKCQNNTQIKYDFAQPTQILHYYSLCHEFSKRTCCSENNLENLGKKISKIVGPSYQLSLKCRKRLTNLFCSSCDGDVGQNFKDGVCPHYCKDVYQDCKDDYFAIDSKNMMKVCREEDIVCSKLSDILLNKNKESVCELLSLKVAERDCWNGQISANLKGKGKKKVSIQQKQKKKRKQTSESIFPFEPSYMVFVVVIGFLLGVIIWKLGCQKYSNMKRQIRYL